MRSTTSSQVKCWLVVVTFVLVAVNAVDMTPDEVQAWMLTNQEFDWQQDEADAVVQIAGKGAQDAAGNLYFAGSKTLDSSNVDLLNLFVARINADGSLGWTKEWGSDQADAATSIAIIDEKDATTGSATQFLYVAGYTWGFLDEGSHALNGFGQYGGRDVVVAKVSLDGDKLWLRQFGTTANDFVYSVALDGNFNSLLLSGGCATNQVDETVEVDVEEIMETRTHAGSHSAYESQIMDPKARTSAQNRGYDFAVSLNFGGDVLDYAMDGGVTLTPRRRRIREGGLVAEYAVVLNRQPLANVVVQADDVRLVDPRGKPVQQLEFLTSQRVEFTPSNWNREQLVRLTAVDDALAEGRHYAVVTHSVSSEDPNFDGKDTPFLTGRNVTVQIDDNDLAGVSLSRQHVFVAEGGGKDSYEVVLRSQPWYPVTVTIKPLHGNQTAVSSSTGEEAGAAELVFQPDNWDKPQRVVVSAVDDAESEVEYGGLYSGGPLLHYTESKDIRYHTKRPQCFDVANCDPLEPSVCLLTEAELLDGQTSVRVCDITNECSFALGNGACIAHVVSDTGRIPARFGSPPVDPGSSEKTPVDLSYTTLLELLQAEEMDSDLSTLSTGSSGDSTGFEPPPPELRGFVLSFLGLMNVEQAQRMSANPRNVLHTICAGIVRLETMRWAFEEWPTGYVDRVLDATFAMFPQSYSLERHAWNCGMVHFLPGNSIDVSIWDNDPGVTLSTASLEVTEGDTLGAEYDVVLNAPPSIGGSAKIIVQSQEAQISSPYCGEKQSDVCGFWGEQFQALAAKMYDESAWNLNVAPNVSIAIVGNSQVAISPSFLTFTATNWFVPQRVVVRAVDDAVAERNVSYTVSHRVQNSAFGYTSKTAFWFQNSLASAAELYPVWETVGGREIPYNPLPTVLHAPDHKRINVFVNDNDVAEVNVVVRQPEGKLATKEAADTVDWVGDYVTALAFHDVSVSTTTSDGQTIASALRNILVFAPDVKTFMKFHLPRVHEADTALSFSGATLVLHQTPYKIFNVSELDSSATGSEPSSTEASFTKDYLLKVTVVDNSWTAGSVRTGETTPQPLAFLTSGGAMEMTATVEKSRSIEVDLSPLLKELLPTRLSVVSLQIEVLSEGGSTESIATTQLCSSVFERKLRPLLSIRYAFPNLLSQLEASQSSTAVSSLTQEPLAASLATNGAKYDDSVDSTALVATTESESEPWWEVTLSELTKLGTLAVFLPASIIIEDSSSAANLVAIASLTAFNAQPLSLDEAVAFGCPSACPRVERLPVRKGILLWDVQAGAVAVRIYLEGTGALQLAQVQAFDSFVAVTPTADGAGIRSRLKSDWGPSMALLKPWSLLQTVRKSENENLAIGMATRQSSTSPSDALAYLAVDGLRHTLWDPLVIQDEQDDSIAAGSTRTDVETDPWWEVDLGAVKPIRSVVLYPYVGSHYDDLCAPERTGGNGYPAWSGDLYDFSLTDPFLQLKAPFLQQFDVLLSDQSLTKSDGTASGAAVIASKTLSFSCADYTNAITWSRVFSNARFVTVRKRGQGVLMLNEVEVERWNAATTSKYLLIDLFATGEKPLALTSVQVFPPGDVAPTDSPTLATPAPIPYKIHSVSSQLSSTGAGSATALLNAEDRTLCYVSSAPSYHEWVVLEFTTPVDVGLVDIDLKVDQCSTANVESVTEFSVAAHGSVLEGIRSQAATQALASEGSSTTCTLTAAGEVVAPSSQCKAYVCGDKACQTPLHVKDTAGKSLVLSDFVAVAVLGKAEFLPVARLPLSVHEHRALLLRDNPVVVWPFDENAKVLVGTDEGDVSWGGKSRTTSALPLTTTSVSVDLRIADALEGTFFSAAVAIQPAMSSFSLEFWFYMNKDFAAAIASNLPVDVVKFYGTDAGESQVNFGSVGISIKTSRFFFEMTNPVDQVVCQVDLGEKAGVLPVAETWHQAVAIYDPVSSSISLSICLSGDLQTTNCYSSSSACNMALLSFSEKVLRFGAAASDSQSKGFVGLIASAAWYVRALTTTEMLDHYHDFLDGVSTEASAAHNTYSIGLSAKPLQPVTVQINAESACYRFNLCNVSVVPSVLVFTTENWNFPQLVHVLATDDQLYEGLHQADLFHVASSPPLYQLTAQASTSSVNRVTDGRELLQELEESVTSFYKDFVFYGALQSRSEQLSRQDALVGLHTEWAKQPVKEVTVSANAYAESIHVASVSVTITDLSVPGIEFSTASLSVSEDGKGNDYQVVLLSEPTEDVIVTLHIASGCYRRCVASPLCPSRTVELADGAFARPQDESFLSCGDDTESMSTSELLCNVTVSPDVLAFSPSDWSLPKTVRVLAVDDHLDEEDVHLAVIRATSDSLDAVYNKLVLPDIVVAIADNDVTDMAYSVKLVALSEKGGALSMLKYPSSDYYTLQLLTEPYADVTIAMSNEANQACYRRCGYPFDETSCGLPRQQSVSLVHLRSNSTREIHQLDLRMSKITEVQRIVTYAAHVDQIFTLRVSGGFGFEVQAVVFQFNEAFKKRYTSGDAITASSYGRTFTITNGAGGTTSSLDVFATALQVQTAVNGLFAGTTTAVSVTRDVAYAQSTMTWSVTFRRLVSADGTFPVLSVAVADAIEGVFSTQRTRATSSPSGTFKLSYGAATFQVPVLPTAAALQSALGAQAGVYSVTASRRLLTTGGYGFEYVVTFVSVESYASLAVNSSTVVASVDSTTPVDISVLETQAPVLINGAFVIDFFTPLSIATSAKPNRTAPVFWNESAASLAAKLVELQGVANVTVARQKLSAEGAMVWTVQFLENYGNVPSMIVTPLNLTGKDVTVGVRTVRDGEPLRGNLVVQMGGWFKKTDPRTSRAFMMKFSLKNTTAVRFDATANELRKALLDLEITEQADVSRVGVDCDIFSVCNGYTWVISYANSPGNLPPIAVFPDDSMRQAPGMTLTATTVANGTYLGGSFSLKLELLDPSSNRTYVGTTWKLPVNVSAIGMDEALEALSFVRSNREAEYDPETKVWRGIQFDKGVRVYREGPYLDGGHTWRLEWALEDYMRFADLKITMDVSLVTQEIEPLPVPSKLDLQGKPRCSAIPTAIFQSDTTDPLGLRGHCVYAIANETAQERFLCNYTVLNPWIVFTPENWCVPQQVKLVAVDDFLDETSAENGKVTVSKVTHTAFTDDYIYLALPLPDVVVKVESDDVAKVLVSESMLEVSEDGVMVDEYNLQLNSEPLASVKIVVLPWLESDNTQCYRFGLCNVTLPVSEFVFTPRNWDVPQKVVVLATDDNLDEYDTHLTGISHLSYSDDPKYNAIATIPKISVTVHDNDVSGFVVNKTSVFVTEGLGAMDSYSVVLTSEPFARVTVSVTNVGTVGNLAVPNPTKLVFTWRNWNLSQTVNVTAFDDRTQDALGSSSALTHSLTTNDLIYAKLQNLAAVKVVIADNDKSGIELSTRELRAVESNTTVLRYSVRLTSEPWAPVVVQPNASHGCYLRVQTSERVCNASLLSGSTALYFGATNWSVWQNVSLLAVDDWLDEASVHTARISHASTSTDPLYAVSDYAASGGDVKLFITDNDVSFVNISIQSATNQLHVAEGSFNDSYSVFLNSEPYEYVTVTLRPAIDKIVSTEDSKSVYTQPQLGTAFGSAASSAMTLLGTESIRSIQLVFTPLDWARPRVVTVFAIDDEIPEAATQYSTVLHAVASADAGYNISNSSIGVVGVAVMISDREAIPPPLPVTAIFDRSGSKVNVAFDSAVFHAASMSVSSSGAYVTLLKTFSCSLVFNFAAVKYALGSQAYCLWLDGKNLRMELTAGATIAAGDKLVLNDCKSFADQYCNATDVLRARPSSRAFAQASIALDVPADIVQPNAVLVVPESAGSCGTWSADASLSSGAGGRPFAQLTWFALPASLYASSATQTSAEAGLELYQRLNPGLELLCQKYKTDWLTGSSSTTNVPAADMALATATNAASDFSALSTMAQLRSVCYLRSVATGATTSALLQLTVNSSLLEPGANYHVGLKLVNAFAQTAVVSRLIAIQSQPGPAVFVVGDSSQTVSRVGAPVVMQVDAVVTCPSLSSSDVVYGWTATSQSSDGTGAVTTEDFSKDNSARDPRVFRLPRSSLQAGRTYTFRAAASMKGASSSLSSSSFASIVVSVSSSLPQVSVKGGDCALGERDALVLDGSATLDPDYSSTPFTYAWTCQDVTNSSSVSSCLNASASPSAPLVMTSTTAVLRIAPFNLVSNRQLNFSLTASKGSRSATASSTVWTVAGHLPVVRVTASAAKINPSSRLALVGAVSSDYPYKTRWTQTLGDLVLPTADTSDTSDAFTLPLTSANNAIRSFTLTSGLTYNFRLEATDTGGNVGFGAVAVVVNSPPTSGTFAVSPRTGYAMQDAFTLTCSLWSDDVDDYPLTYSFGVLSTDKFAAIKTDAADANVFVAQLGKAMTPLVASQLSPQATATMLPPSGMEDSESVTVVAFISDRLGAVAVAYDTVEVLLPEAAKSQPAAFVSRLFTSDGALKSSGDASENVRQVLAAAMVLEKAFGSSKSSSKARRLAESCPEGLMGSDCTTEVAVVQQISSSILTTLAGAVGSVEPSSSSLGQQARVLYSVMKAAPEVLSSSDISQVTQLCSGIAGSALTLTSPAEFLDSTGETLLEVLTVVLGLGSAGSSSSASTRRLADTSSNATVDDAACGDTGETAVVQASWNNMVRTLQSLAALGSSALLADEPPAALEAGDIRAFSSRGVSFTAQPTSALGMNLTSTAVSCLDSNLFVNAFSVVSSPHSACTLNDSEPISRLSLFSVHSQTSLDHAAATTVYSSSNGVDTESLDGTSACVSAASESTRRLEDSATETWVPLVALTIPHERTLSAVEQRNFSTSCRTWDAEVASWSVDVCFKDDSASTSELTVCYCTQLDSALEVLVTLEERLDFYALHPEMYRNDQPSLVVSVALAVLVGVFVLVAKVGQHLDSRDVQREKLTTIKRLNRAKWNELEARTQIDNVFDDFDAFYVAQKRNRLDARPSEAPTAATDVGESSSVLYSTSVRVQAPVNEPIDVTVQLPDEARTLFESSPLVDQQYRRVTLLFRVSNLLLALLGLVLLFAGIEVQFVLGRTPAELVLYLYGGPLGVTLVAGGVVLLAGGIAGVLLARRDASNAARTAYLTLLGLGLLAQFLVVLFAFHLLENFDAMPHGVALALRSHWDALSSDTKTQLQASYGCCGFLAISEEVSCPEEALDAVPPRTCSMILGSQASSLFTSSFIYVKAVLFVEIACVALANFLVRWRRIRLVQLATSEANASAEAAIIRSLVFTALLCSLPPLYALLACTAAGGVVFGADLMVHWGAMADPLVSALFGVEIGAFIVTGAVVCVLLSLWALRALGRRDVRALRWVLGLSLAFVLLTLGVRAYLGRLLADFYVDPVIIKAIEAKYVTLSRSTMLNLEMNLECCGFSANAQGTCVDGASDTEVPTCQVQVGNALERALSLSTERLSWFAVVQAVVLVLLAWLSWRLRRFSGLAAIQSSPADQDAQQAQEPLTLSQKLCTGGLALLNLGAAAAGIGVLSLGVDVLFELNVLQMSYLLRVFDRRLGLYLLVFGGVMEVFALFGGVVAWLGTQQRPRTKAARKWLVVGYSLMCVVLFVAAFVLAGVGHKLSSQFTLTTDGGDAKALAVDTRVKDLWSSAPSTTKLFVQNALQCCGYDRVEAANGSVSYTLQAEEFGWRRLTSTSTFHVYSSPTDLESRNTRVLTETKAESALLDSTQCPSEASDGCANPMKHYVSRVARIAWQLCSGLAGFSVAALLCATGLHVRDQRESKWHPRWRLRIEQSAFLLMVLAGSLAALACFVLGLDVSLGWTLFSSSAFQLVFARSMGSALMVYAVFALLTHAYSTRAALHFSVHQLFLQCVARFVLAAALFAAVGFTAYLSHYSSATTESWRAQLTDFLDDQWGLLTPATQNMIALEFSCCGFNDPVLVAGEGVVFDRPALGYAGCSLAIARGCKRSLVAGVETSFAWLFAFLLALALLEIALLVLGALTLRDVRNYEGEAWFALESRLRYVAGSFRRDFRRQHVLVSVGARFDARLTRTQRAVSVLCAWAASLAVYAGYFATKGCYRTSLKSCEQPGAAQLLGLGLVYGGAVGLAAQTFTVALFEHVRHRADDETKEVATARQRKEKVLLFRAPWFQRRRRADTQESSKVMEQSSLNGETSTIQATQTTTEERWFVWLTRFVALTFQTCGVLLFLGGCALATLLGLLRLGYNNSLYGVPLDEDVFELLAVAGAVIVVALIAALANDLREQQMKRAHHRKVTPVIVTLVVVAIVAVLALGAVLLAVFMIHEVVQDDASALNSWSVRTTGFSVVKRLETAWKETLTGYAKANAQQEMRCCGFWSATDAPFLPCPQGDPVEVTYEAVSVSGTVVSETKQEYTPLPGCRSGMLARFHAGADVATYCALTAAGLLFLIVVTSLFLARELAISKDAKLKLRVPESGTSEDEVKRDLRETFETVVGLKIAAPARGKLRSQLLASSLDSVAPTVASELAAAPLKHEQVTLTNSASGQLQDGNANAVAEAADVSANNVPYPASIVYVVFALCLVWLAIMAYVVAISAMDLGLATSWRCVMAWAVGVVIQELVVEPIMIFFSIVARTLRDWWARTLLARILRRGRALLRIGPQDAKDLEREQRSKSLSLYDRLRYAAAVRIQRRLLTRVTRGRYLRRLRAHKQEQHRLLAVQRRETLRKTLTHFSEEEIEAFRLLFATADAAQLGLVSHTAIAQAVYELGVHVPATKVREQLEAFDPAYADLVDFEHFLYGMHCVRVYHQQLQVEATPAAEQPIDAKKKSGDEKLVSSSDRFGPRADPRAELLVKRQNLLRELRDRRESLAHKLMRKVSGKLPPLMQRGKSGRAATIEEEKLVDEGATEAGEQPTGTYVFWQNRKLSPKKRALESVLKKQHQQRLETEKRQKDGAEAGGDGVHTTARTAVELDAVRPKTSSSPTNRALKSMTSKRGLASRQGTAKARVETAVPPASDAAVAAPPLPPAIAASASGDEEEKPSAGASVEDNVAQQQTGEKVAPVVTVKLDAEGGDSESRAATAVADLEEVKPTEPTAAPKSPPKAEEAKPFGAYLLLTKQAPPLPPPQRQTTEADIADTPRAPEKPKPSGAQTSLQKALLKKQKTRPKPT